MSSEALDSPEGTKVPLIDKNDPLKNPEEDAPKSRSSSKSDLSRSSEGHGSAKSHKSNGHLPSERGSIPNGNSLQNGTVSSSNSVRSRHVVMEQVAPSTSSILAERAPDDWKLSLNTFTSKKHGKQADDKKLPRRIRRYYKRQDELIDAFEDMMLEVDDAMEVAHEQSKIGRLATHLARATFFINLMLLIGKAVAAGLSGSLSIISAVIDSGVDLVSGALMWWSNQAMKERDPYTYPQGKTKLEPIAIVILSVIMALASVQMIRESVEKIINYSSNPSAGPTVGLAAIIICCCTVVIKLILYLVCRKVQNPTIQALAQDHRNDVLSNTVALVCGVIGTQLWNYADPIGAIVISLYIMGSWFTTGWEQIKMLTGHTARPDFLKKITWISLNHHPKILFIDTVRVYHFGNNFIVEVDVVLPEDLNMRESHDIGESLQLKIERLNEVERAFVHLDYECDHDPRSEHKVV